MNLVTALRIDRGEVVALVGGGGKTSAMIRLGRTLVGQGQRVLLTTTTRLAADQTESGPALVTWDPDESDFETLLVRLRQALTQANLILLISGIDQTSDKALGLPSEIVDALAQSDLFEVIIIEADGAKKRPFKAPAPYEPVIPASTTLVVPMVGLDVLGRPLTEETVHRPEQVCRLGQAVLGDPVTAEMVAAVLTHPAGGLKGVPTGARVIPFLNKAALVSPGQVRALARLILADSRIEAVGIGDVQQSNSVTWVENRVAAVVLAAGQASRFGSPKQLALWQGKPLLAHAVDAALASQAERVVVVLGANAEICQAILGERPLEIVFNERWAEGQSTSMKAGLTALPPHVGAALFPLADQPGVTPAVIDAIIATYQHTLAPIVWPEFEGQRGNPVLFDRCLFAEMNQVTGDIGARPVLKAHQAQAERVAVSEPGILYDIDTPDDL